jgi:hypothetical protein
MQCSETDSERACRAFEWGGSATGAGTSSNALIVALEAPRHPNMIFSIGTRKACLFPASPAMVRRTISQEATMHLLFFASFAQPLANFAVKFFSR